MGFGTDFNRFLNSQNIYLCHRKPKNDGPFLFQKMLYQSTETIDKRHGLRMARMETDCNLEN